MAKKELIEQNIELHNFEDIMGDRFGRYSKYIIQERALPDARDGLKPVQRRILYAMFHEGNVYDKPHRKSAKTVGIVIGNYHPHGESSVYDALVRLSQDWKMRIPLVDMHGNNGSIDDDPAAAMRYTEARLSKISSTFLEELNYDTVSLAPNFDDTENEPTVLPNKFPLLLANGSYGIASGYATNIPPHNLGEVIDGTIYRLQNPECSVEEIMTFIKGPDFPTGGIVQGEKGIVDAFKTGRGKVVVRAKAEIIKEKTLQQIIITEIPYEVIKSNLVKKMDDIRIGKDVDGILDIRDESDRTGLKIVVDVKKDIDATNILNYFYKNTELQINYNYNMVAIVDKTPKLIGILGLLDAFIEHRKEVVVKKSKFLLNKMENRIHIIEGLMKAISILDEIIAIIRASKDKEDSIQSLINEYAFSRTQAEAIVNLRLYRLSNTDIFALREEFAELINKIEETKTIIENENVLISTIIKELKGIKDEYGSDRRTFIEKEVEEIVIDKTSIIPNEKNMITVSRDGYIKRVSLRSFQQSDNKTGIKDGDELIGIKEVETIDTLLLFTTYGNYAYLPIYQLDEMKWKDVGNHLNKYISIDSEEKIINAIVIKNFDTNAYILTASKKGLIKKSYISSFKVLRFNKVISAMKLDKDDSLIKAIVVYDDMDIVLVSKFGYMNRFKTNEINPTDTNTKGVWGIKLSKDDELGSICDIDENDNLLIINSDNYLKRLKNEDVSPTTRYTKGKSIAKILKNKNWDIKEIRAISLYDDLSFISDDITSYKGKDVQLMTTSSSFSNTLHIDPNAYFVKGIDEAEIIDKPHFDSVEDAVDDYEQLDLFEK